MWNSDEDDEAAQTAVFLAEVGYYFPEPADLFEDGLAELLGLPRPEGVADGEWRSIRMAYLEEQGTAADRLAPEASP